MRWSPRSGRWSSGREQRRNDDRASFVDDGLADSVKVLAALSGGVDSAVAAARAVDAGQDVTAVHLALSTTPAALRSGARGCCSLEDARDARRAADVLGIPFYVWDVAERFGREVVDDFVAEYAAGRTPNPCIRCNERIKFAAVLDRAVALGFDLVCTGHYARLDDDGGGRALHRALDPGKDQSYVLAVLAPWQLARAMFPLGDTAKADVRREAHERGLAVADKPDSHDVCFIADGDTAGWLRGHLGDQPGPIVDAASGAVVGAHDGAYAFTVGQRRGLRIGRPATDGLPRYVLDVSPVTRTVTVGTAADLDVRTVLTGPPTWCGPAPELPTHAAVQMRAHGEPVPAYVEGSPFDSGLRLRLESPARGIAPGQTAALYDADRVLGSATIERADGGGSGEEGNS